MKTNQIGNRNFSIRIFSESGESIQDIFREGYVKAKVTERLSSTLFRIVLNGRTLHAKSGLQLHPGELLSLKLEKGQTGLIFRLLERSFSKHHLEEEKFIQKLKGFTERPISNLLKEAKMSTLHKSEDLKVFQILNTLFPFLEWKEDVACFFWKFQDGEAEAYFGKKAKKNTYILRYSSSQIGNLSVLLDWQEKDLKDLKVHFFFNKERSYETALFLIEDFSKEMLASGFKGFSSSIYYLKPSENQNKGSEWLA